MLKAKISEIFVSIQGEGLYVGIPHLFLRFYGCNLCCDYCDTPQKKYREYTVQRLLKKISTYDPDSYRMISLTGGEPLLHAAFLKRLLPRLRKNGPAVYLETNASLPDALKEVYPWVDIISADVKIDSLNDNSFFTAQKRFIRAGGKKIFLKIVVTKQTTLTAAKKALACIGKTGYTQEIILQPETAYLKETLKKSIDILRLYNRAGAKTRIIPQMHRLLSIR